MNTKESELRKKILSLTQEYFDEFHSSSEFKPGHDYVNYVGRVFDYQEGVSVTGFDIEGNFSLPTLPY